MFVLGRGRLGPIANAEVNRRPADRDQTNPPHTAGALRESPPDVTGAIHAPTDAKTMPVHSSTLASWACACCCWADCAHTETAGRTQISVAAMKIFEH